MLRIWLSFNTVCVALFLFYCFWVLNSSGRIDVVVWAVLLAFLGGMIFQRIIKGSFFGLWTFGVPYLMLSFGAFVLSLSVFKLFVFSSDATNESVYQILIGETNEAAWTFPSKPVYVKVFLLDVRSHYKYSRPFKKDKRLLSGERYYFEIFIKYQTIKKKLEIESTIDYDARAVNDLAFKLAHLSVYLRAYDADEPSGKEAVHVLSTKIFELTGYDLGEIQASSIHLTDSMRQPDCKLSYSSVEG